MAGMYEAVYTLHSPIFSSLRHSASATTGLDRACCCRQVPSPTIADGRSESPGMARAPVWAPSSTQGGRAAVCSALCSCKKATGIAHARWGAPCGSFHSHFPAGGEISDLCLMQPRCKEISPSNGPPHKAWIRRLLLFLRTSTNGESRAWFTAPMERTPAARRWLLLFAGLCRPNCVAAAWGLSPGNTPAMHMAHKLIYQTLDEPPRPDRTRIVIQPAAGGGGLCGSWELRHQVASYRRGGPTQPPLLRLAGLSHRAPCASAIARGIPTVVPP